ncbi:plac8 onzin related protein 6 [Puntigrus tetrazona]|uniref:plac8 onzin related protein 6 n=1 Tax=Puntigrus tetrazona TaxID=1606681 RepID=UPI001C8ADD55|nr:plac8 onzin related protein 6 [Puntigrus tetrazona]XP_043101867.1 plac8 onzin related protein 6 [Puntigrus tetrazona]XP_043101868.1 plac8 onzin related protein 6 [Puntigrus tetrazona]
MAHSTVSVQPAVVLSSNMATQWSSGVCDCCEDMGICCCGLWCPFCLMCKTSEEFGECLCLPLLEMCFGGLLHPITLSMRSSMRERFHIKGSIQDDCCTVFCCHVCVWCQMARELKARRQSHVIINTAINTVHHQPQAYNQPTQAINTSYQPLQQVNPAY